MVLRYVTKTWLSVAGSVGLASFVLRRRISAKGGELPYGLERTSGRMKHLGREWGRCVIQGTWLLLIPLSYLSIFGYRSL
jgi:hypothetical protein